MTHESGHNPGHAHAALNATDNGAPPRDAAGDRMSAAATATGDIAGAGARHAGDATTADPIIEMKHVSFAYDGPTVLDGVDLRIEPLDFVCIVGPNGGGKTTLIKLILGLLKPRTGTIRVFGRAPDDARVEVGYVPQRVELDSQFPISVIDTVLLGRLGAGHRVGRFSRQDKAIALDALRTVDLADLSRRPFSALSGGQRQRVLIARALAGQPRLLLLDEPTANLDPNAERDLYELLNRLNRTLTLMVVTHDIRFVSQHVKSVVCVSREVRPHRTREIADKDIQALFGGPIRVVRHDHGGAGHDHALHAPNPERPPDA
jgi:zinc transport system ATP-binding protein